MLKLHTLAEWMYGFLEPAPPYGLPEEMYNLSLIHISEPTRP